MQLKLLLLCAGFSVHSCCGWANNVLIFGRNPKRLLRTREELVLAEGPIREEPAGVEAMFTKAKTIRKSDLENFADKAKPPGNKTAWLIPGGKRRKQRSKGLEPPPPPRGKGHVGKEEIANMTAKIALPDGWKFRGDNELESLATMKIFLEKEFEELHKAEVVTLSTGESVNTVEAFPDVYGDMRLLRFLRKQPESDPLAASMSYRKFLNWRKQNKIDEMRAKLEDPTFEVPPELEMLSELLPCEFDTKDSMYAESDSGVIISLHIGQWRTWQVTKLVRNEEGISLDDSLDYWTFRFELLHKKLYAESIKREEMIFVDSISDLKGFSLQQLSPAFVKEVLRPWIEHLQSYYPETAKRINVINPPKVLSLLWKIVTPMIRPGTVAKIRIH